MLEFLKQQISLEISKEAKVNRLRELLQLLCLKIIYDKGYFSKIAFVGGTALRFIYGVKRFSEDLNFSVVNKEGYGFNELISLLKHEFRLYNLEVEAKPKVVNAVHSSMLKFPKLLNFLEISNLEDQKISIKLEINSNPPLGGEIETTLINRVYILNITHLALTSLFATKIHACFFRKYTKGRDFYDLLWYFGKKTRPNYELLNNAVKQTENKDFALSDANLKDFIVNRLERTNFDVAKKDVERFLEDKNELKLFTKEVFLKTAEYLGKS